MEEDEPLQLSTLLVARLTRLLDLNSLEEIISFEECGYVKQNIDIEQNDDLYQALMYEMEEGEKPTNQLTSFFRSVTRRLENQGNSNVAIPKPKLKIIIQLIEYLETDVSVEGLFRISGNKKRQTELKSVIRDGHNINYGVSGLTFNAHDVSGILKELLGELKVPLLTKQLYDCYQQVAGKFTDADADADADSVLVKQQKLETLQILFLLLPPLNRLLMKKLVKLLAIVADNEENKMDAFNLAVVFAPNIICTRVVTESAQFTENMEPFTDLLKFIIENSANIFDIPKHLKEAGMIKDSTTFCKRVTDPNNYRKETQTNTNAAITMLYAQVQEMPDGKMKTEFMNKFQQSYPGTPIYVPQSVRESAEFLISPCTPILQPELSGAKVTESGCGGGAGAVHQQIDCSFPTRGNQRMSSVGLVRESRTPPLRRKRAMKDQLGPKEKMQEIRERKLQDVDMKPASQMLNESFLDSDECSVIPNLDKLSHISLSDSPRSGARELLSRRYRKNNEMTKSPNRIESVDTEVSLLSDPEISVSCITR